MNDEVLNALMAQMKVDGRIKEGEIGAVIPMEEDGMRWNWNEDNAEEFFDDLSGERLDPALVRKARAEEMEEVRKHGLYRKVKIAEAIASGWTRGGVSMTNPSIEYKTAQQLNVSWIPI